MLHETEKVSVASFLVQKKPVHGMLMGEGTGISSMGFDIPRGMLVSRGYLRKNGGIY